MLDVKYTRLNPLKKGTILPLRFTDIILDFETETGVGEVKKAVLKDGLRWLFNFCGFCFLLLPALI